MSASSSFQRLATITSPTGLEGLQVVGHLGAEELWRVQRGLVDHHGHALGLHALYDARDGARAEVIGVGLHRQAVDT